MGQCNVIIIHEIKYVGTFNMRRKAQLPDGLIRCRGGRMRQGKERMKNFPRIEGSR